MHQALNIRDVLQNIVLHMDEKRHLAAIAQTSRLFFEVAVAHLYERLDSEDMNSILLSLTVPSLRLELASVRLRNFAKYGVHVRNIHFNYERGHLLDDEDSEDDDNSDRQEPQIYTNLRRALVLNGTASLFPNLRTLIIDAPKAWCLDIVPALIVPTLEELSITVLAGHLPGWPTQASEVPAPLSVVLDNVLVQCPLIRKLGVFVHSDTFTRLAPLLATIIKKSVYLTSVACQAASIDASVMEALASHDRLEDLRISFPTNDDMFEWVLPDLRDSVSFRRLRAIDMIGMPNDIIKLTVSLPSDLADFSIQMSDYRFGSGVLKTLVDLIRSQFAMLRTISIRLFKDITQVDVPSHQWSFDVIQPLLSYASITSFTFDCLYPPACPLDLQDHHVTAIARAWPDLEVLRLLPRCIAPGLLNQERTPLTLQAVKDLAINCLNLTRLELDVLDVNGPQGDLLIRPGSNLVTLNVQTLIRVEKPEMVATSLSLFWPYLVIGYPTNQFPPTFEDGWRRVAEALRLIGYRQALEHTSGGRLEQIHAHLWKIS